MKPSRIIEAEGRAIEACDLAAVLSTSLLSLLHSLDSADGVSEEVAHQVSGAQYLAQQIYEKLDGAAAPIVAPADDECATAICAGRAIEAEYFANSVKHESMMLVDVITSNLQRICVSESRETARAVDLLYGVSVGLENLAEHAERFADQVEDAGLSVSLAAD